MASIFNLSQPHLTTPTSHLFSEMDSSLSLDLSLGGSFSKRQDYFRESFKAYQSSTSFPVEETKSCALPSMRLADCRWDVPSGVDGTPLLVSRHESTADHFEAKNLQAQRRHEARKRRKSIIEGKLHKRAKGDSQEDLTRLSRAHNLHFLTPRCDDEGKEGPSIEKGERADSINCEEFECKSGVDMVMAHPNGILPVCAKNELLHGQLGHAGSLPGSLLSVWLRDMSPAGHMHIDMQPAAMIDFMDVLSSEKNAQMGMKTVVPFEVDGDVSSAPPSAYNLQRNAPLVLKKEKSFDALHGLNNIGDAVSSVNCPSSLSSNSSGFSHRRSCAPHEAPAEVIMPTCGSSSQLLSWNAGEKFDNEGRHHCDGSDSGEYLDKSCISSSSEIGNHGCARDDQGSYNSSFSVHKSWGKEEQAEAVQTEAAQPTVTMPAIYPHPFPMMPLPYPYGIPLPWSFSLPWFMQSSSLKAFGIPPSSPPSVEQSKEAFPSSFSGLPNQYPFPAPGGNTYPWLSFGPTGAGARTPVGNLIPVQSGGELDKTLHPSLTGQEISDCVQDLKEEADLVSSLDKRVESAVPKDREDNVVIKLQGESVKAMEDMNSDEPMEEKLKESGLFTEDGKSSDRQTGKHSERGYSNIQKHLVAERQQRLPLAKKVSKKKKVVRFNSIDGAGMKVLNKAINSVDGNENVATQPCESSFTQTSAVLSNAEAASTEVGPQESWCRDEQNLKLHESHVRGDSNLGGADDHNADDTMHSGNSTSVACEVDQENGEGGSSPHSQLNKSAKENLVGSHTAKSLLRVITHGSGPLGKTIRGVMYITQEKQARLICVCHGNHMSPLEFVEHSGSSDLSNPERSIVLEPFAFVGHDIPVLA